MVQKQHFDEKGGRAHHQRVKAILGKLEAKGMGIFGAVDVGVDMSWWDYGQLALFHRNAQLLMEDSEDASLARQFFGIADTARVSDSKLGDCSADNLSVVTSTVAKTGSIASSVVANTDCNELCVEGAVIVGVCAKKIKAAKGAVAYNVCDSSEQGLVLGENEVRVGIFTEG